MRLIFLLAGLCFIACNTFAQQREQRVALVIGNSAYKSSPLKNPANDARAMAAKLRTLGFETIVRENLRARDLGSVYREFRSKISPGGVALVFYAGHGIQFKGQNYFPAVDSDINSEEEVPLQSLNLSTLLDTMEEAKAGVSLVFLDACRDNPFARKFRSASNGLAKVEAASGTLIHYATKPGSVAADGDGKNGTYTEALLAQMSEPGVPVELMLKKVTNSVVGKTKGKQEPWVEGSLRGDFYFFGPTTVQVQTGSTAPDPETETWAAAESVKSMVAYQAYLDGYPNGRYAIAANIKLNALKPSTQPIIVNSLEWQSADNGSDLKSELATTYCQSKGGDWRLPSVSELLSLFNPESSVSCGSGAVCLVPAKFKLTGAWFWSSETTGTYSRKYVVLTHGTVQQTYDMSGRYFRALCVRPL